MQGFVPAIVMDLNPYRLPRFELDVVLTEFSSRVGYYAVDVYTDMVVIRIPFILVGVEFDGYLFRCVSNCDFVYHGDQIQVKNFHAIH